MRAGSSGSPVFRLLPYLASPLVASQKGLRAHLEGSIYTVTLGTSTEDPAPAGERRRRPRPACSRAQTAPQDISSAYGPKCRSRTRKTIGLGPFHARQMLSRGSSRTLQRPGGRAASPRGADYAVREGRQGRAEPESTTLLGESANPSNRSQVLSPLKIMASRGSSRLSSGNPLVISRSEERRVAGAVTLHERA